MGCALNACSAIPLAILLVFESASALARQVSSDQLTPRVKVASGDGVPGAMVTLALSLENGRTTSIAEIVARVAFPPQVRFIRFEAAPSLKVAAIGASAKDLALPVGDKLLSEDKRRAVEIRITRTRQSGSLPDGIFGQLVFTIEPDTAAETGEGVHLPYEVKIDAFGNGDTREPAAAYSNSAKIHLASATVPVTACFFYMH
jgi:hypothetical protein